MLYHMLHAALQLCPGTQRDPWFLKIVSSCKCSFARFVLHATDNVAVSDTLRLLMLNLNNLLVSSPIS